jgi:hypothetical protein
METTQFRPKGWNNWVGPVGAHKLDPHAKEKVTAQKLWELSEKETGVKWNF